MRFMTSSASILTGTEFEDGQIAQINLLHYPVEGVLIGGELIWGERNDIDGADGYDVRA